MIRAEELLISRSSQDPYRRIGLRARNFAAMVGVPLGRDKKSGLVWNGQMTNLEMIDDSADVIHDCCHFMIAPPHRRHQPEYGLGHAPETTAKVVQSVTEEISDNEEGCVSVLGMLWERKLGYNQTSTLVKHGWLDIGASVLEPTAVAKLKSILLWLYDHGFIDVDGSPTIKYRADEWMGRFPHHRY